MFITFLPADSEDGQIFICGIFLIFLALHVGIFLAFGIARGIFFCICFAFFDIFFRTGLSSHNQP